MRSIGSDFVNLMVLMSCRSKHIELVHGRLQLLKCGVVRPFDNAKASILCIGAAFVFTRRRENRGGHEEEEGVKES
jgi:hypothetical protein